MKTLDALKRLERAGAKNSRTTLNLKAAAVEVARSIIDSVPPDIDLPRGYKVIRRKSIVGGAWFLQNSNGYYVDAGAKDKEGYYLHGDFHCWITATPRQAVLSFANDISTGLLDEIAEFLEKRTAENEKSAKVLESKTE